MLNTSFAPWPSFTQEEADAVSAVLLSNRVNYWTGEECRAFEREFAAWSESNHAIAVANGTVALDLASRGSPSAALMAAAPTLRRSEDGRSGNESVSTLISRCSPYH